MTLREYLQEAGDRFLTLYHVRDFQELEVCRQVWEIVLDGLEVYYACGGLQKATLTADLTTGPIVVEITLEGEVGRDLFLEVPMTGPLKVCRLNS